MPDKRFFIVDVFAEQKFGGDQLAVFLKRNQYTDDIMQKMAREMNFSETTFIMSDRPVDGAWPVRIFTPNEEVPFAGHPTLGTAYIIQKYLVMKPEKEIILAEKAGNIPVAVRYKGSEPDILTMTQLEPVFGEKLDSEEMSGILQIEKELFDDRFPIEAVSTGLPALIIPLKSLDAVKKIKINRDRYFEYCGRHEAKNLLVFAPKTYDPDNNLNVRMFADYLGVPQDPATGSANGCLAGYLARHRYSDSDLIDIRVEQGYEIKRPSILYLKASYRNDSCQIEVGGKVNLFSDGIVI